MENLEQIISKKKTKNQKKEKLSGYNINPKGGVKGGLLRGEKRGEKQRYIARMLVDKLGDKNYFPFYLKCAWRIPESQIWQLAGTSLELGSCPRAYFICLAEKVLTSKTP